MYDLENIPTNNRILILSKINNKPVTEILISSTLTLLSGVMKPRLKDYDIYLIETGRIKGVTVRNKIAGRKPWSDGTHGIPNHIDDMFQEYELEDINEDFFNHTLELLDRTLKAIYDGGHGEKVKEIYDIALSHPNFLYSMLQISVRLLGQNLQKNRIELKNKTLNYMLKRIEDDKVKISNLFKMVKTSEDKQLALINYYNELSKYFDNFLEQEVGHDIKWKDAIQIAEEKVLLDQVGEENTLFFIGQIIAQIQERYRVNIPLIQNELITIK